MKDSKLAEAHTEWNEVIGRRRVMLEEVQNRLIELEAELAERLRAIQTFEFGLRARVRPLVTRLDQLESEIKDLLNRLQRDVDGDVLAEWAAWSFDELGAEDSDHYRYRDFTALSEPVDVSSDDGAELKRLYRQLARRFHPDMARDEKDRAYRTQMMMAINAAYASGNLEKLNTIALEPDAADTVEHANTQEELANALRHEIDRCRRRIEEIQKELTVLATHQGAKLMQQVRAAQATGRDLVSHLIERLREDVATKMVERDALKIQLEEQGRQRTEPTGAKIADVIWDLSLEQSVEETPESAIHDWVFGRFGRYTSDDDILDDVE